MRIYVHIHTGSADTAEGWINSYDKRELEARGLSADEAFSEDLYVTLIPLG